MTVLEAISKRRAVRTFAPTPVPEDTVRGLIQAAVRAPTAMHAEPWAFVVIQDRALLKKYSDLAKTTWSEAVHGSHSVASPRATSSGAAAARVVSPDFNIFYDAGTLVAICAKPLGQFVAADCWLAAENLMLAATASALGTCPIGFAVPVLNRPDVKAELGIPADVVVVAPIIIGVPRQETPQTERKTPDILSWRRP